MQYEHNDIKRLIDELQAKEVYSDQEKEQLYKILTGILKSKDTGLQGSSEIGKILDIMHSLLDNHSSTQPPIEENRMNLIKQTCKELNLTYKELGEAIGYGEGAVKNSASTGNVSEPMQHAIKMYRRILELEAEVADSEAVKANLKKWLK